MLSVQVDEAKGVAILEPRAPCRRTTSRARPKAIDPHIKKIGFVRGHHRKIRRVALCTDSAIGNVAPRVARHFVAAEVRAFKSAELELAMAWAAGEG